MLPPQEPAAKTVFKMNWFTTWCLLWEAAMIIIFGTACVFTTAASYDYAAMYTMMQVRKQYCVTRR